MKKVLALLMCICMAFGAAAFAEEPVAAETPAVQGTEETEAPADEGTEDSEFVILGNGWITTAQSVLEITEPAQWMEDRETIAFIAIMLLMDAYETEDFALEAGKYYPQNAYVGLTLEGKNLVMYPSVMDNTVLELMFDQATGEVSGKILSLDSVPNDELLTAVMTQLCDTNVNKADYDAVTYILQQFAGQ